MQVQITRWGNSLGSTVPKDVAARFGLKAGARVDMAAEDGRIVISLERPVYGLDELLVGMTPATMHDAFERGPDLGRKAVE
ncbi:MAG TPA: AbrB/MazE/SpoVT family DNA-binding domain-containing protein [Gammaproteobacteria bacterium]|nr:AbrB/MazE/SpoVT family DNA-binding domain-containing protein [Gammaproteobacteria bacterium]